MRVGQSKCFIGIFRTVWTLVTLLGQIMLFALIQTDSFEYNNIWYSSYIVKRYLSLYPCHFYQLLHCDHQNSLSDSCTAAVNQCVTPVASSSVNHETLSIKCSRSQRM